MVSLMTLAAGPEERRCAHKRAIVRDFAPHLNNAALARQERRYFLLGLARVLLVFVAPACAVFYLRDWSVSSPAAIAAIVVSGIELAVAFVSFFFPVFFGGFLGISWGKKLSGFVDMMTAPVLLAVA